VGEDWRISGRKQDFLNAFAEFYPDMRRLLAAIPAEDLFKWGLFLRPRLHSWVTGRVALLGDAAHPMLPYLGQGGAMAIEDAMILARTLASSATPEEALQRYQAVRMDRVSAVADASEAMSQLFHTDADDYTPARDVTAGQMGSLYTYDAVTAPIDAKS
jgi:salicylate hydroxylase